MFNLVLPSPGEPERFRRRATDNLEHLKMLSKSLDESEHLVELLWNHSPALICVVNETHFVKLNPAWERELGWSQLELMSRPYLDFIHPDDRAKTVVLVETLKANPITASRTEDFSNRYQTKEGDYKEVLWFMTAVTETNIYGFARVVDGAN